VTGTQNIWAVLGIERTADVQIIRRAYARQLKVTNPEDDAEAFERLRAAYDRAMEMASRPLFVRVQRAPENQPAPESQPTPEVQPTMEVQPTREVPAAPESHVDAGAAADVQPSPELPSPPRPLADAVTPLQQLQSDFQALDAAIVNPAARDEERSGALFARCLSSPALENIQVLLQFERSVASWLLMRRPASEFLFADAVARFGWSGREKSVGLPPDITSVLRHLRDLQFWAKEQESKGARRRARRALLRKPNPAWLRAQMVFFNLDRHVKTLLGEVYAGHGSVVTRLNADAVAWWREYFSKPRLMSPWLSLLTVLVPVGGVIGWQIGISRKLPVRDAAAVGAMLPVAVILCPLLFKLYVIDWPKRWYLAKSRAGAPAWLRLGWLAAASVMLVVSALLPSSAWGFAVAAVLGGFCVVWVSAVTPNLQRGAGGVHRVVGYWLLLNFPLVFAWSMVANDAAVGPAVPVWPAIVALLIAERVGRAALLDEYRYGLSATGRTNVLYAIAAAAGCALILSAALPARSPWLWIEMAVLSIVVVIARTPALVLTATQNKIRYYALWLPAIVILEAGGKHLPFMSHLVQVVAAWLMAGVFLGMAMVGYNQVKARAGENPRGRPAH
jgi:hypothetical protein